MTSEHPPTARASGDAEKALAFGQGFSTFKHTRAHAPTNTLVPHNDLMSRKEGDCSPG